MIDSPPARVAHSIPGRLRLRFERGARAAADRDALVARLSRQPGVRTARYHAASGSFVVEYDPAAVSPTVVLSYFPAVEPPAPPPRSSPPAHTLIQSWWGADASLARLTGGWLDLRTLVPLALALLAVQQILRRGDLQAASWHTLLWYSYNLFYHFHPELRQPPGQPRESETG